MRHIATPLLLFMASACSTGPAIEPSLAPRAAETIDPRIPIPDSAPTGSPDAALAERLNVLVAAVRGAVPAFEARETEASRLASAAGPIASESWIAAQQALSQLIEQYGVTTQAAADIDALASARIENQRWIQPADREAIAAAAAEVADISNSQAAAIGRLKDQLAR